MPKRLSTEEWITRARGVWGDTYDYSLVQYKKASTPVTVICRKPGHGPWPCNPDNHVAKHRGCPVCGGSQRKTFKQFVADARRVHEQRYRYLDSNYVNASTKIQITCRKHGDFPQTPDAHIRGENCPTCGDEARSIRSLCSETELNKKIAEKCEGSSSTCLLLPKSYRGMNRKARLTCSLHGIQAPRLVTSILASKHPCIQCAATMRSLQYSTAEFRDELIRRFGHEYEIGEFIYEGKRTELTFYCAKPGHGEFHLQAGSIYKSPGCQTCAYEKSMGRRKAGIRRAAQSTLDNRFERWLEKAKQRHGDLYDYSEVIFSTARTKVLIGCPIHGYRPQTPDTHLRSGCRLCADENLMGLYSEKYFEKNPRERSRPALLYYIRFSHQTESFYKVGMTATTVATRFGVIPKDKVSLDVLGASESTLYECWKSESKIQRDHGDKYRYTPELGGLDLRKIRIGPSECFSQPLPKKLAKEFFSI